MQTPCSNLNFTNSSIEQIHDGIARLGKVLQSAIKTELGNTTDRLSTSK